MSKLPYQHAIDQVLQFFAQLEPASRLQPPCKDHGNKESKTQAKHNGAKTMVGLNAHTGNVIARVFPRLQITPPPSETPKVDFLLAAHKLSLGLKRAAEK